MKMMTEIATLLVMAMAALLLAGAASRILPVLEQGPTLQDNPTYYISMAIAALLIGYGINVVQMIIASRKIG